MSTWTDERHEAARARCEAATDGPWDDQPGWTGAARVVLNGDGDMLWDAVGLMNDADGAFIAHARTDIPALLDEIERLRAESARRMVWLEREQNAHEQTRAALIDMTERAARPVITDDMVTAARKTMDDHWAIPLPYSWACECGMTVEGTDGHAQAVILSHIARTGLEAALNPGEGA
jgi:hypothetical protein